jgi:predicted transcriptional regulator
MVRTQLYLDDDVHRRLRELAQKQGRTISDLVREAVARAYGTEHEEARLSTLEGITGLWRDRDDLAPTDEYVRQLRRDTRRKRRD